MQARHVHSYCGTRVRRFAVRTHGHDPPVVHDQGRVLHGGARVHVDGGVFKQRGHEAFVVRAIHGEGGVGHLSLNRRHEGTEQAAEGEGATEGTKHGSKVRRRGWERQPQAYLCDAWKPNAFPPACTLK